MRITLLSAAFLAFSLAALEAASVEQSFGKIPLSFEKNRGQTAKHVDFLSRGPGYTLFLSRQEAVLALAGSASRSSILRMKLVGSSRSASAFGVDPLPSRSNYMLGTDSRKWTRDVPHFGKVEYRKVYPGIDLLYYGKQRELEYDFRVSPGADPSAVRLRFEGSKSMRIDESGDLILVTDTGDLRKHKPVIYQELNGSRVAVDGGYRLRAKNEVAFVVGEYRRDLPLVIDPVLSYSTYLGGTASDTAAGIAVDSSGSAYIVGTTTSVNFPKTGGAFQGAFAGETDVFVAKLNPTGSSPVYSTFIGGPGSDYARAIAVNPAGEAYILALPGGSYPITPGAYNNLTCCDSTAVTKLNASGNQLVYSAKLDGEPTALAIDAAGNTYIAGLTGSTFITTVGAFQTIPGGFYDAFVRKLNAAGTSLVYSTLLGGSSDDVATAILVDATGSAYVAGSTGSSDFPATQTIGLASSGSLSFVSKINTSGSALSYSTLITAARVDDLAVSPAGEIYLAGIASSQFATTAGSYQPTLSYGAGYFGAKLNVIGTAFSYATFLTDGYSFEARAKLAVDSLGNANYALASSYYEQPTTPNAFQQIRAEAPDGYLIQLNPSGSILSFATYLGGSGDDRPTGIATDSSGNVYLAGTSSSTNLPTTPGALQPANAGSFDAFVVKIDNVNLSCSYSTSPSSQAVSAEGTSGVLTISAGAGCVWVASSSVPWVQISGQSSGIGSGAVNFSVSLNDSTQSRSGLIVVGGQTFTVTQPGAACIYSIAPQSLTFSGAGGISNVSVSSPSGCPWTATSNQSWVTITSGASNSQAGLVRYSVAANTGAARVGTMTIAGQTFTVNQSASGVVCSYTLSSSTQAAPASGGSYNVNVSTSVGCGISVTSNAAWITATANAGAVNVTVAANVGVARTGSVSIAGQTFTVTQSSGVATPGCTLTLGSSGITSPATGSTGTFSLANSANCSWVASSSSSWAQVYPLSGSSSGTIQYTVFPNYTTTPRSSTLNVGGQTFTITQAAAGGTANERFVGQLYFNFFGRIPSSADLSFQVNALNSGLSRADMVMAFFNSQEFSLGGRFVAGLYVGLLNRDAEYGGWLFQRNAFATGIVTQASLIQNFMGSAEYLAAFGTPDNAEFVRLLYRYVLLREPQTAEVNFQTTALQSGNSTRNAMASAFLNSSEFRQGTGSRLTSFLVYALLLLRDPTPVELSLRVSQLQSGLPVRDLVQEILNSSEFSYLLN